MTRRRLALVLAVVAVVAVLATAALAAVTYLPDGEGPGAAPLVVTDPESGASFRVPAPDWEVRGARSRIYYADERGRPVAVVRGPAVYRDGYCAARPGDSNRGFAGFTRHSFGAWLGALGGGSGAWTTRDRPERVVLADGSPGTLRWRGLLGGAGECAAPGIEVAMLRAGDVRVVLVADSGAEGTLAHADVRRILLTLRR